MGFPTRSSRYVLRELLLLVIAVAAAFVFINHDNLYLNHPFRLADARIESYLLASVVIYLFLRVAIIALEMRPPRPADGLLRCPECGVRVEKIEQLPSKAPFSKRFEEIVGEACESAAASQVARRFHLPETTVRAIDMRYLERWDKRRRKPALKQMGVDEIYRGKNDKFLTVVSNLETGEPLWFGKERKKETLDEYFRTQLRSGQRKRIEAA